MSSCLAKAVACSVLLAACDPAASQEAVETVGSRAIYGEDDDRTEVYGYAGGVLKGFAQQATAALVDSKKITVNEDGSMTLNTTTLGTSMNLCEGVRFAEQPVLGHCSATLIGDKYVLTARHCLGYTKCDATRIVFNYYYEDSNQLAPISNSDVYKCKNNFELDGRTLDYAVIELDRAVTGRTPVAVPLDDSGLETDHTVTVLGFPNGIPMKITPNGRVTAVEDTYFNATTDTFHVNSGSGVYDEQNNLVGILRKGEDDYAMDGTQKCKSILTYPNDNPEQEYITRADRSIADFCKKHPDISFCK